MTVGIFEVDVFKVFQKHLRWKSKISRVQPVENRQQPGGSEPRDDCKADAARSSLEPAAHEPGDSGRPRTAPETLDSVVLQRMRALVENWREDGRIVANSLDSSIRFSAAYEVFAADLERELEEMDAEISKNSR